MGFRVCVRTALSIRAVGRPGRICAPEGRLRIARRFQRRVKWNTERVPEGRLKFSRTLFSSSGRLLRRSEFFRNLLQLCR
jgi:hypothetical protein